MLGLDIPFNIGQKRQLPELNHQEGPLHLSILNGRIAMASLESRQKEKKRSWLKYPRSWSLVAVR